MCKCVGFVKLKADIVLQLMMESSTAGVASQPARLNWKRWRMSVEVGHSQRFWVTHGLYSCCFISKHFDFSSSLRLLNQIQEQHPAGTFRTVQLTVRCKPACLIASLIIHILSVFDNYLTGCTRKPRAGGGGVVRTRLFLAGEMNRFH